MKKYLIDVNLPCRFSLWSSPEFEHIFNINDEMKDCEIWEYAKENNLTIVTKDTDFSELMILNNPPPKVIHIKIGNMKINELHQFLNKHWKDIIQMNNAYKLVRVYRNKLEGVD